MANTPRNLALVVGALAMGAAFVSQAADEPPKPELIGGASAAMLSETCAGCHGTDGLSGGPASPIIAGMNKEYFIEIMKGYREGKVYSTIMGRIAKGYSEEEIASMAGFYAAKPYKAADQKFDQALADKGKKLHDKYCEKCHSEGGKPVKGEEEEFQILAGQWTPYVHNQMEDFRAERREMPKKMKDKLDNLLAKDGDAGLKAVLEFYASEK